MTVVTLYGKPGCHLCDDAREVVSIVGRDFPFELREVDVSIDAALQREYGERIPVVAVDGVEELELVVEPQELEKRVATLQS